jgi:hypothetical protein
MNNRCKIGETKIERIQSNEQQKTKQHQKIRKKVVSLNMKMIISKCKMKKIGIKTSIKKHQLFVR